MQLVDAYRSHDVLVITVVLTYRVKLRKDLPNSFFLTLSKQTLQLNLLIFEFFQVSRKPPNLATLNHSQQSSQRKISLDSSYTSCRYLVIHNVKMHASWLSEFNDFFKKKIPYEIRLQSKLILMKKKLPTTTNHFFQLKNNFTACNDMNLWWSYLMIILCLGSLFMKKFVWNIALLCT